MEKQKTILITGADAGLGLSLVKRFLQGGFAVFAGAYRSMDVLNILALDYGDALSLIPLDVAELESVRAAARQVSERTDTLDIIINNAGIHLRNSQGPLEQLDFSDQQLQQTMEVNAFGPLRVVLQSKPRGMSKEIDLLRVVITHQEWIIPAKTIPPRLLPSHQVYCHHQGFGQGSDELPVNHLV